MNVTISIDATTVKAARIRALEQGTSVNEVVRQYLRRYAASGESRRSALESIFNDIDAVSPGPRKTPGRRWRREDAYRFGEFVVRNPFRG